MIITSCSTNKNIKINSISFKKGLTKEFVDKVEIMEYSNFQDELDKKNIKTKGFENYKSVASSCLAVSEILQHLNLQLPHNVTFESLGRYSGGRYVYPDDIVMINSDIFQFKDLKRQDNWATYQKGSPITKHFLHTYLHEFIHAAHYHHLATLHSLEKIQEISETLHKHKPTEKLVTPDIRKKSWQKWEEIWNESILGSYANKNLIEFFTENASFEIARLLENKDNKLAIYKGKNIFFNPQKPLSKDLSFLNDNQNSFWAKLGIKNKRLEDRNTILKAIWDGNLDIICDEKYSKYIKKDS